MQILFIDDESKKYKSLRAIVDKIDGIDKKNDIEYVVDLNSAKDKLSKIFYDLVIIDLKISDNIGEFSDETSEFAGMDFIDEIIETDFIKTPKEIIILTEYDELHKKCEELGKNLEFQILKYDEQSLEWQNIIRSKIEYYLKYEKSREIFSEQLPCDVAVICAVDVEMDAINRIFCREQFTRKTFINDSTDYYLREITTGNKRIKLAFAQQREMGIAAATNLTQSIIYHFNPRYIIMVGIAAGIGNEKSLGDILIATEVWNYSSGKYICTEDGALDFSPDPKHLKLNADIEGLLRRNYSDELLKIRNSWFEKINSDLKTIPGTLACGSAVVANKQIVNDMIKNHDRKAIGLDMESYGVFYAATYGLNNSSIPICIKSISDFADEEKNDGYQKYAAYTSTAFAKFLIEDVLPLD